MQPSIIKSSSRLSRKIDAWHSGLVKTGYLRTSAIPDLSGEHSKSKKDSKPAAVEAIEFNQSITAHRLQSLIKTNLVVLDHNLAKVDFDQQVVDVDLLKVLLPWIEQSKSVIHELHLASMSKSPRAWRFFMDWLTKSQCHIKSINLGHTALNLSRVKDIAEILQDSTIAISRIDLGQSEWQFSEMKAFLWMGGLSRTTNLTRIALGDSKICDHSLRLLIESICHETASIQVFSSGVVQLSKSSLNHLMRYMLTRQNKLLSCILSNQVFGAECSELLSRLISESETMRNLGIINCWIDQAGFENHCGTKGCIPALYVESITAGQIQQITDVLCGKGYEVNQQISRHRVRMTLQDKAQRTKSH